MSDIFRTRRAQQGLEYGYALRLVHRVEGVDEPND